ncbi:MAG TPA: hypothetical protein VF743_02525, partial [Acidimicrobiales bacterium]
MPPDGAFSQASLWPERWAAQPLDRSGTGPARPSWASTTVAPGSGGALDGGRHGDGDGVQPA